jgi:hypothetical protein
MKMFSKDTPFYHYVIIYALAAAFLLLIPLVAMQLGDEVNWDLFDFVVAWVLLFGTGVTYKLVAGNTGNILYRIAAGVAVSTALILVWSNLAVGLIGSESNPANLMYLGVLTILFIAALIARFKPFGMSLALLATAFAQMIVTIIAVIAELGFPENTPAQLIFINGFFLALWGGSALLFWFAARIPRVNNNTAE